MERGLFFPIRNPDGDELPLEPQTVYVMFSVDKIEGKLFDANDIGMIQYNAGGLIPQLDRTNEGINYIPELKNAAERRIAWRIIALNIKTARSLLSKILSELSDEALEYVYRPIMYAYLWTDGRGHDQLTDDDMHRIHLYAAASTASPQVLKVLDMLRRGAINSAEKSEARELAFVLARNENLRGAGENAGARTAVHLRADRSGQRRARA